MNSKEAAQECLKTLSRDKTARSNTSSFSFLLLRPYIHLQSEALEGAAVQDCDCVRDFFLRFEGCLALAILPNFRPGALTSLLHVLLQLFVLFLVAGSLWQSSKPHSQLIVCSLLP